MWKLFRGKPDTRTITEIQKDSEKPELMGKDALATLYKQIYNRRGPNAANIELTRAGVPDDRPQNAIFDDYMYTLSRGEDLRSIPVVASYVKKIADIYGVNGLSKLWYNGVYNGDDMFAFIGDSGHSVEYMAKKLGLA